eukprot:12924632-Prorocentrum_lima.AAC.1
MEVSRPKDQQVLADPVPPGKFAETHTWVKGTVKGSIVIFVDGLLQSIGTCRLQNVLVPIIQMIS